MYPSVRVPLPRAALAAHEYSRGVHGAGRFSVLSRWDGTAGTALVLPAREKFPVTVRYRLRNLHFFPAKWITRLLPPVVSTTAPPCTRSNTY